MSVGLPKRKYVEEPFTLRNKNYMFEGQQRCLCSTKNLMRKSRNEHKWENKQKERVEDEGQQREMECMGNGGVRGEVNNRGRRRRRMKMSDILMIYLDIQ